MTEAENTKAFNAATLSAKDFTEYPPVVEYVAEVKDMKRVVSDILDDEGHQYVNLVQKGGGVLGVALVGYTYVLEQAGIRFLKMAGTSAGAINTSLIVIQKDKTAEKSPYLLKALSELEMIKLVDGHRVARMLIEGFVKNDDFGTRIEGIVKTVLGILALLLCACFIGLGFGAIYPLIDAISFWVFVVTGLYITALAVLGSYIASLLKRLKGAGFGINPGDFFL